MLRRITSIIAAAVLIAAGGIAQAAPGRSGDAPVGQAARAQSMQRDEVKARDTARERTHDQASDQGMRKESAEERAERAREMAEGKGEQTSAEMQARREERKQIQEEYRDSAGDGPRAKKKPWWKFWASDDDARSR